MIQTGINAKKLREIKDKILEKILGSKDELGSFLEFTANKAQFSFQNLVLLYGQAEDAKYIAAEGALISMEKAGFRITDKKGPFLILSPVVKENVVKYDVLPMFSFDVSPSEEYEIVDRADQIGEEEDLREAFSDVLGEKLMVTSDPNFTKIQRQRGRLVMPNNVPVESKINMLVEYYAENIAGAGESKGMKTYGKMIFAYLYYSRYPNKKFLPPLDLWSIPGGEEEKTEALKLSILQFKHLTDRMRKPQVVLYSGNAPIKDNDGRDYF